jgi:hypothetical protein
MGLNRRENQNLEGDETPRRTFNFQTKDNIVICYEVIGDKYHNYHIFENAINYETQTFHKVYLGKYNDFDDALAVVGQHLSTNIRQGWIPVANGTSLDGFGDLFKYTEEYLSREMAESTGREWRPIPLPELFAREITNPFGEGGEGFRKLNI